MVESLIIEDLEYIAQQFESTFTECIANVKKPNVLVSGVTGAGKSSLVNAIFGEGMAKVGVGKPLTQHFSRYAPDDMPVVVYDSKGLEQGFHEEFVADAKEFLEKIKSQPELGDHIHIIWYVINAGSARIEPFEAFLIKEIFAPVPTLFILNKADIASAEQLNELEESIKQYEFTNCRGIFRVVADRKIYPQNWCVSCAGDDVMFKKSTNQLFCEDCGVVTVMTPTLGLEKVVDETSRILPDLAKEAFLSAQEVSFAIKDSRAKAIVKEYANKISMDVAGKALSSVGEMVGKVFVLWGWKYLGEKVSATLEKEMSAEFRSQELTSRLAMVAADTISKRKLSRSVIACLGLMVNRPLRKLSKQLLSVVEAHDSVKFEELEFSPTKSASFPDKFVQYALAHGIDAAIDNFWG